MAPVLPRWTSALAVAAGLLSTWTASASILDPVLVLHASNATGAASLTVHFSDLTYDPTQHTYGLSLSSPTPLTDPDSGLIATLVQLNLTICQDVANNPRIVTNWTLDAGSSLTTVSLLSGTVGFAPQIPAGNAHARASASFTLYDLDYNGSAALHAFPPPGNGMYHAFYNSETRTFASLVNAMGIEGGPGAVVTAFQNYPPAGFFTLTDALNNFDGTSGFTLTAGDEMSANTNFVFYMVPEPAALAGASLGVLLLCRHRQ
jgi:hypothetical protein